MPLVIDLSTLSLKARKTGLAVTVKFAPVGKVTLVLRWPEVVLIVLFLATGWLTVHFRTQIAASWLISIWAPSHLHETVIIITTVAGVVGLLVTIWKKKQLFTYGIAEIAFALFTVFQIALHLWPTGRLVDFLAIGSALYVVSRGFGNLWDAFVQETEIKRLELQIGDILAGR